MLIIFDCDGVLRSVSWEGMHAAYVAIAKHLEVDSAWFWTDTEEYRKWHNNDWHFNLERMGLPRGSDYTAINRIFHAVYDPFITKFPWVDELLVQLKPEHELAVFSSASSSSLYRTLSSVAGYFSCIVGADNVVNVKPHPEGIHLIMKKTSACPDETIMVGDSCSDILAGKKADVKTVGVAWGMTEASELKKYQPDFLFHEPEQLCEFLCCN